ncbi:MAG: glutaredoxin 3 [Pseudomonadota bacterium]
MSDQSKKIEVYFWTTCPYCVRARELLDSKGVNYTGYDITGDEAARAKMVERTGGPKSVPQIFVDDVLIGGCDDIHALDAQGKLDSVLGLS